MTLAFTGDRSGKGRRFGVAVSRFSKARIRGKRLGEVLLDGCLERLREAGVAPGDVFVVWVPGAFRAAARRAR